MMALRVTPLAAEVEGAEEEGGTTKIAGSVVSTYGHFGRSRASLRRTKPAYMEPMMVKRGERGRTESRHKFREKKRTYMHEKCMNM